MIFYRCNGCLYSFKTGEETDDLRSCPHCDGQFEKMDGEVSIFSNRDYHIASGRDGFYSMALGRVVESETVEEEIMRERGFIKETELNRKHGRDDYFDHMQNLLRIRETEIARLTKIYNDALAEGKSPEDAVLLAYNTEDALSGKLERLFSKTLTDMENYNA